METKKLVRNLFILALVSTLLTLAIGFGDYAVTRFSGTTKDGEIYTLTVWQMRSYGTGVMNRQVLSDETLMFSEMTINHLNGKYELAKNGASAPTALWAFRDHFYLSMIQFRDVSCYHLWERIYFCTVRRAKG